jgi:hypothetical protein
VDHEDDQSDFHTTDSYFPQGALLIARGCVAAYGWSLMMRSHRADKRMMNPKPQPFTTSLTTRASW